jgi:osmotically inducible protein OsmC
MTIRTARTAWNGTLNEGSGQTELTSSGAATFEVSWPRRIGDTADGVTSPEELIAAAHSSCYSMQLSGLIGRAGATPVSLDVQADVSLVPDPAGGVRIDKIHLTVRGEVEGMDAATFVETAENAKATCPVSKALTGVDEMTVDAALKN